MKEFTIRNDQAKDGLESTFYMTTPPLISVRLLSLFFFGFWKGESLNHQSYSPYLSACDFFLFPRLKKMLSGNKYTSRSSLGSAIYQCLKLIPTAGLGGSVGCVVRLETRRSRVQPPPRSATFFRGDWSWNIFYGHSLPSADSRRAVVSFWRKNVHNTG